MSPSQSGASPMTPRLDAIRERHRKDRADNTVCVLDRVPWPCEAYVLSGEVERLRARVGTLESALRQAVETSDRKVRLSIRDAALREAKS